jgi:regulator of replication initiation timing
MSNVQHASEPSGLIDQMQLQQMVFSVVQQVQQHQTAFQELQALKDTIQTLQSEKQALADENQQLRTEISKLMSKISNPIANVDQPLVNSQVSPEVKVTKPTFASVAAAPTRQKSKNSGSVSLKKRIAAARVFKTAEAQGPQGFTYVYLGRSRKFDRLEVRSRLRRAGVDTGRVIDVCFPASGVIGILLHTQYVDRFTELMTIAEAEFIKDFDPLDPAHLADPRYDSLSLDARANEMAKIVHSRCINTLSFVRPLLVSSVGRSFVEKGWMDDETLDHVMVDARRRLAEQDPKKAAFAFRRSGKDISGDSDTEMSQ